MRPSLPLGYALNAFPYEDLCGMMQVIRRDAPRIKRNVFPTTPFPVEVRFSQQIVDALRARPAERKRLHFLLHRHQLQLLTINAFVPRSFHTGRVKENVYLPAWNSPRRDRHSRVAFTNDCIALLAELMDDDIPFASVSVPAGVLKKSVPPPHRVSVQNAIARAVAECAQFAFETFQRTGKKVLIGLEPEPGLTCETTSETIYFFHRHLWKILPREHREFVGVNFDLCHQLVQWEDPLDSVCRLLRHNIPLTKIHLTNAIQFDAPLLPENAPRLERLRRFYAQSKYLHQTIGVDSRNRPVFSSLDLPRVLSPSGLRELATKKVRNLRIHYHMPLFENPQSLIATALPEVVRFLNGWKKKHATTLFCAKSPSSSKPTHGSNNSAKLAPPRATLCFQIARELQFVRNQF